MLKRWQRWRATPRPLRHLLVEAALQLLWAQLSVRLLLKGALAPMLELQREALHDQATCREVRRAIAIAAAHVPWRSVCLPNAIAARRMLGRRGISSQLHLGVGLQPSMHAHAWLKACGIIVTGADGLGSTTQVFPAHRP